jgi:CheY-like chemotaxis protein
MWCYPTATLYGCPRGSGVFRAADAHKMPKRSRSIPARRTDRRAGTDRRAVTRSGRRASDQAHSAYSQFDNANKCRILVVDDFRDGREMLTEYLTHFGFEVHAAQTAAEALDQIASFAPDLVVMDVLLPDADGIAVIPRLRALATRPVKIIVFTAVVLGDVRSRARAVEADMFVPKPCDLSDFIRQIRHLLEDICEAA